MANPFLADIQNFTKTRLKKVQTKVITADGQKLIETKDAQGNIVTMTEDGTVVPSQASPPGKISAPPRLDQESAKLGNGMPAEDSEQEKGIDAVKSGINRGKLDRQASIDAIKSSVSLKSRLAAFGGSPDEGEAGKKFSPNMPRPHKIATSKFETADKDEDSAPPSPTLKSAAVSAARNKFIQQEKVADDENKVTTPAVPKKQWSPPPKSSAPSPASHHQTQSETAHRAHPEPAEIEEDVISKRLGGSGKQCTEVLPGIFMGYRDLKERLPDVSDLGITHILNFLPRLVLDNSSLKNFIYKKVEIPDNPTTDIRQYFPECFEYIEKALTYKTEDGAKGKVLLFCTQNEHISSCVMIGYLVKTQNKTYKEALDILQEKRQNIKPGENFSRRLKHYEKDLEEEDLFGNIEDEDLEALAKELDSDAESDKVVEKSASKGSKNFQSSSPTKKVTTPTVSPSKTPVKQPSPPHPVPKTKSAVPPPPPPSSTIPTKTSAPSPQSKSSSSHVTPPTTTSAVSKSTAPNLQAKPTTTATSRPSVSPPKATTTKPTSSSNKLDTSSAALDPNERRTSKLSQLGGYKPPWG